jgi:hypothetical protein
MQFFAVDQKTNALLNCRCRGEAMVARCASASNSRRLVYCLLELRLIEGQRQSRRIDFWLPGAFGSLTATLQPPGQVATTIQPTKERSP